MPNFSAKIKIGGRAETYHFEFRGDSIRAKAALEQKFGKGSVVGGVSIHGTNKPPSHAQIISVP